MRELCCICILVALLMTICICTIVVFRWPSNRPATGKVFTVQRCNHGASAAWEVRTLHSRV